MHSNKIFIIIHLLFIIIFSCSISPEETKIYNFIYSDTIAYYPDFTPLAVWKSNDLRDIWCTDSFVYICGPADDLIVLDITDIDNIQQAGYFKFNSIYGPVDVVVRNNNAYVSCGYYIYCLNVRNKSSMIITSEYRGTKNNCRIVLQDTLLCLADDQFAVLNISMEDRMSILAEDTVLYGSVESSTETDAYFYIADEYYGIRILELMHDSTFTPYTGFACPFSWSVIDRGDVLAVSGSYNHVYLLDITARTEPELICSLFCNSTSNHDILIEGENLYVLGDNAIRVYDISDIYNPIERTAMPIEEGYGMALSSKYISVVYEHGIIFLPSQ